MKFRMKFIHILWHQVADDESWAVIDSVPFEPYFNRTDSGGITTRWLDQSVTTPFQLSVET